MVEDALIAADGQPRLGYFEQTPSVINIDDFTYRNPMGGRQWPGRKWLDCNQFQYIGLISDELLIGCALGDIRYLGFAFAYTYQPATGELTEFSSKVPLGRGISLTKRPLDGTGRFTSGGNTISISADINPRIVALDVDLKSGLRVRAMFNLDDEPRSQPMALCTRTAANGWTFTQKIAGVRATGHAGGSFGEVDLAEIGAFAHYDYTVGYLRRETFWNWACFSGEADGRVVGLNLSCGVNETSYSENCLWVDGALVPVGLARFDYDRARPHVGHWTVTTADGAVDLMFEPEGVHEEKVNVLLVASNFKQVFGRFSGVLRTGDAGVIEIKDQYGFVEDQYAKW